MCCGYCIRAPAIGEWLFSRLLTGCTTCARSARCGRPSGQKKALETERVFVPLAHYLGAHDVGVELARLSARYRADDQPRPQRWAARVSSVVMSPREHLSPTLTWARGLRVRMSEDGFDGDAPAALQFSRPLPRPRALGSERRLRRLILQLDDSEPQRAHTLYASLRPLHERLSRHQAVMMRTREASTAGTPSLRLPRPPVMSADALGGDDELLRAILMR